MHPLFVAYVKERWGVDPFLNKEVEQDKKIFSKALVDTKFCMSVHWSTLSIAGNQLSYDFNLGLACRQAYGMGWEYNEETKRLKALFQQIVCYKPLNKELEDYL